jgi:putative colanic acid biosynthesis acetyltransferase WcaF
MNLSNYHEEKPHFAKRAIWYWVNLTIFRWCASSYLWPIRRLLLRMFGAQVDKQALVYASCRIFAPWNLSLGRACVGPRTELYSKDKIVIGDDCVVSQGAFLCTASHSLSSQMLPLITAPIYIANNAWVAADAFIGMGVTIGEGAVVGARAAVFKDVEPWTVVGGNPARFIKKRVWTDVEN